MSDVAVARRLRTVGSLFFWTAVVSIPYLGLVLGPALVFQLVRLRAALETERARLRMGIAVAAAASAVTVVGLVTALRETHEVVWLAAFLPIVELGCIAYATAWVVWCDARGWRAMARTWQKGAVVGTLALAVGIIAGAAALTGWTPVAVAAGIAAAVAHFVGLIWQSVASTNVRAALERHGADSPIRPPGRVAFRVP